MNTRSSNTDPDLFRPLPVFSEEINRNIVQSEVEGGVYLKDLDKGTKLEVQTENRVYQIVVQEGSKALISGHPEFCPEPVLVSIHGSSWGGSMLKMAFIGRGMHLEFRHPEYRTVITSPIVEIRSLAA
jgi:hypothetical protein